MSCRGASLSFTNSQHSDLKTGVDLTSETTSLSNTIDFTPTNAHVKPLFL
jgi:hypothetical protein